MTKDLRLTMTCFLVLFLALLPHVSSVCDSDIETKTESYVENVCDPYRYRCRDQVKTKEVLRLISFYCIHSSLDEMYAYNADGTTQTHHHFIVRYSSLGSLKADGKLWLYLTTLTLSDDKIFEISPGFFNGFSNLTLLGMPHNNISTLEEGVFSSLTHLQHLNLSYNAIERIEPLAFAGLSNLEVLDLQRNKIVQLPDKISLLLPKLTFLNVSDNFLNQLFRIAGIYEEEIVLRNNSLSKLVIANDTSPRFRTMDASANNISVIENFQNFSAREVNLSFNSLKNLTRIGNVVLVNISHNKLDALGNSFISNTVEWLDLSFNTIQSISPACFSEGKQLKVLNLSYNKIKQLWPSTFAQQQVLERLDLSHNNIAYFEFGTFDNLVGLRYLNVSSNGALVDFQALFRAQQLETLDFERDEPKNLDDFFFTTHPKLKTIRMGYNTWDCEDLVKMISLIESKNIMVLKGTHDKGVHIHGIECKSSSVLGVDKEQSNIIVNRSDFSQKQQLIILNTLLNILNKTEETINTNQEQQTIVLNKTLNMLDKIEEQINSKTNMLNNSKEEQQTVMLNNTLSTLNKNADQINSNLQQQTIMLNNSKQEQQTIMLNKTLITLNKNGDQLNSNLQQQTIMLNKILNMLNNSKQEQQTIILNKLNEIDDKVELQRMLNKSEGSISISSSAREALLSRGATNNNEGSSTFSNVNLIFITLILLLILVVNVWRIRKRILGRSNEQLEMVE